MKDIKEMETNELREEMNELYLYLYMTKETSTYDKFKWEELDFWDAERRHHKIAQEILMRSFVDYI